MKRYTYLSKIRNYILASYREMAQRLNVSLEAYKKYENYDRPLPTSARLLLIHIEAGLIQADPKFPFPESIDPIRARLWPWKPNAWKGRIYAIESDLIRFQYVIVRMKRNSKAAFERLQKLQSLPGFLPAGHPFLPVIERAIKKCEQVLQEQGVQKQLWLAELVESLQTQKTLLMRLG